MAVEQIEEQYMAFLDGEVGEPIDTGSEEPRFVVDDDSKADWCLRKLRQVRERMTQRQAFVESEIERLQEWKTQQDADDLRSEGFFEHQLRNYFEALRDAGALGKRKSYKLPHGALSVRKAAAKLDRDEIKLLAWAKANAPQHIVTTEKVAWADLKPRVGLVELTDGWAAVDVQTGEMIPGITVTSPEGETFSIKVEGGE